MASESNTEAPLKTVRKIHSVLSHVCDRNAKQKIFQEKLDVNIAYSFLLLTLAIWFLK